MSKKDITCIDSGACSKEHCKYVDGCDQELWKTLIREKIQTTTLNSGRNGIRFLKDEKPILNVYSKGSIEVIDPELVPSALLAILRKLDLAKLIRDVDSRRFDVTMI